jgi:filamentous hemagglutinin family protein
MTYHRQHLFFSCHISPFLIIIVSCLLFVMPSVGYAEVTLDGSFGPQKILSGPDYVIDAGDGTLVNKTNLYHSFGSFNVDINQSATFTGPDTINIIIGRVTGGGQSSIDGLLRSTIPDANLFLLNPEGFLFGPHATLDMQGSFHVSTADYLRLGENGIVYVDPAKNSVLIVDPPSAFGFLDSNPAGISVHESDLEVSEGKTFSLIGGDIDVVGDDESNFASAELYAPSGRINIVSVASAGEVITNLQDESLNLQVGSFEQLGDIAFSQGALISASGDSGGTVVIRGGRLQLDNAFISADTEGDMDGAMIGIDIEVVEDLSVVNGGKITTDSYGGGNAGDIGVRSGSLEMIGVLQTANFSSTKIGSVAFESGNSGSVYIETGNLELRDASSISTSSYNNQWGSAGNIEVIADSVLISGPNSSPDPFWSDFTGMDTSSSSAGNGGLMRITTDHLVITNRGQLDLSTYVAGKGGTLEIITDNMELLNGAQIIGSAFGTGDGGNINIEANNLLISGVSPEIFTDITGNESMSPTGIASQTGLFGGSAGDILLTVGNLEILDGARLTVETFGPGDGGNIEVTADSMLIAEVNSDVKNLLISNGANPIYASAGIFSGSGSFYLADEATGVGGNIRILFGDLQLRDGGLISSMTETPGDGGYINLTGNNVTLSAGASIAASSSVAFATNTGDAGDISIVAQNTFCSSNSSIITSADQAKGGDIRVEAQNIDLINNTSVSAQSSGTGNAGSIYLGGQDTFSMDSSKVNTEALKASGGDIKVFAEDLVSLVDSEITASVAGGTETTGGYISIDPEFVILKNSSIIAKAYEGTGGNIDIVADVFLADPDSVVDASSSLGIDGQVDIHSPVTHVSSVVASISDDFRGVMALLRKPCMARVHKGKYCSFMIKGRGSLPVEPGQFLASPLSIP